MAARNQIEQDLLDMMLTEHNRAAASVEGPPDLPPELFGLAPQQRRQASAAAMSPDAYLDFLCPPSPGRNAADLSLESLWEKPQGEVLEVLQASEDDPLAVLWNTPAPAQTDGPDLSSLWASTPTGTEPDLEGLWDAPGRATEASEAGDALTGLFMTGEAVAQAEITGQSFEAGDIPMPRMARTASSDFNIEFDGGMDFGSEAPSRAASSEAARFRIDRPPPRYTFPRGNVTAQDGVVVGQRGTDGRFQRTAAQAARPVPQPRPTQVARATSAPLPPVTTTKYDILRKGGLDI